MILIVFGHAMYSFAEVLPVIWDVLNVKYFTKMPDLGWDYWEWNFREVVRIFVITAFFVLCGISCTFSRSNLKRGIKTFGVAIAITFVTTTVDRFFNAGVTIRFGVIHMLSIAMILYAVIDKLGALIQKIKKNNVTLWIRRLLPGAVGIIILVIYFAMWGELKLSGDRIGFNCTVTVNSDNKFGNLLFVLMYVNGAKGFYSADFFPLLPYVAIVLMGSIFGWIIYHTGAKNYLSRLDGDWNKGVCFVGKHSIIVYLTHQVVIIGVLFIIGIFVKIF